MSMIQDRMLSLITHYLDIAGYRHGLIAGNMANVDTPGYHTRDLDFRSELRRAASDGAPRVQEVKGLLVRPDGNNVSIDRESLALAENELQFRLGIGAVRVRFRQMLTAINEGRQI